MPHKNLEARREYHRRYYGKHSDAIKARARLHEKAHPRKRKNLKNRFWCKPEDKALWKEIFMKWYRFVHNGGAPSYTWCKSIEERKVRRKATVKKWRSKPEVRVRHRIKRNIAHKKRYAIDSEYRLKCLLCARLGRLASKYNFKKSSSALKLLGCTLEFFKTYMASKFTEGMTFDNHGEWHIDHDVACRKFDLKNPDHQRACFHFSNLQPLWGEENVGKDSLNVPKLTDAEVTKMLESQAFLTRILPVPLPLAA